MRYAKNVWESLVQGLSRSRRGLTIYEDDEEVRYTPRELILAATMAKEGLVKAGVRPGDRVGILAQTTPRTIESFLGCWAAGAVAVPLPLPMRAVDPRSFIQQNRRRLDKVEAKLLILTENLLPMIGDMGEGIGVVAAEELPRDGDTPVAACRGDDIAMVQFTSGSTSEPRGVVLSHASILANARSIIRRIEVAPDDTVVSWMPLYHDMGLIGFLITALSAGCSLVLMSPQRFVADPSRWLQAVNENRATVTGGPNFAYALAARVLRSGSAGDIDLSSLRLALNGAEPVDEEVLGELVDAGEPYGLRPEVPYPVYGLAEATLAVTFPLIGKRYHVDHVCRAAVDRDWVAKPAQPGEEGTRALVSLGTPLEGIEVAVFKEDGSMVGEREIGEVCVRGATLMRGYWGDAAATAQALRGGWLHTGDLGYYAAGELYLVGRIKDMVIVGGRNLFPEDVERCAERVSGIRKGNAVAFGVTTRRGKERLVLVSETRLECAEKALQAARIVSGAVREEIGIPVREVVLVPAGSLPKTSSGKKRRFLCRDLYMGEKLQPIARSGAPVSGK